MTELAETTTESQPESPEFSDIKLIERLIIEIGPETPTETIGRVRNLVAFIGQESRRIKQLLDAALIQRIEETGQDIVLSDTVRLYLGNPPKYKAVNSSALLDAILTLSGSIDDVELCLASGWFKPGAVRSLLEEHGQADQFDRLILTSREPEIKEGKPAKKLLETNAFTRQRKGSVRS